MKMLHVDWRQRSTLCEVRHAMEEITNFYSDSVVFEGSKASCAWEAGMDIDSASSLPEIVDHLSNWSKDSASDFILETESQASPFSCGALIHCVTPEDTGHHSSDPRSPFLENLDQLLPNWSRGGTSDFILERKSLASGFSYDNPWTTHSSRDATYLEFQAPHTLKI